MLSFPSPKWQKALNSVAAPKSDRPPGSRFGRVASLIVPRVYLSDVFTALDQAELIRLGITHVISVLDYTPTIPDVISQDRRLNIRLVDHQDADILSHLSKTTDFITSALADDESNKVLVHCFQGISRSATVVCAYLIASSGMQASEALKHTQAKRGIVCPNPGFRMQLDTYAERFVGGSHLSGTKRNRVSEGIATRIRLLRSDGMGRGS